MDDYRLQLLIMIEIGRLLEVPWGLGKLINPLQMMLFFIGMRVGFSF
jgi:hypothetical protein